MRSALYPVLFSDPMSQWARDAVHAWDFLKDKARWNRGRVGSLANTPGWSFTRASTGYAENAAGVLVPFASGELRRTDKGVLIEGARTNRCLYARDMTNAAWTKTDATAALDQVGMDGAANSASSLTATAGNATCLQAITNASVARNYSFWVKRITGSGNIDITTDNGTTWATISGITTTGWVRGTVTQTLANPTVGVRIVTSGDAIAVDFCQEETGAFPSSPIPTTSAAATRAADVLTVPVSGIDYPLTLSAEFERAVDTGGFENWLTTHGGDSNHASIYVSSSDQGGGTTRQGGALQAGIGVTGAVAVGAATKVALRVTTDNVQAARGGTLGAADTSATNPPTPNGIRFGDVHSGGNPSFGYFRRAAIFNRALSDAELQAVTL